MKKILLAVGLAAVLVMAFVAFASAEKGGKRGDNQVAICHFDSHDGDFVTTGRGCGCLQQGGDVIIVGRSACAKGHGAGGDCTRANIGRLDEASCK